MPSAPATTRHTSSGSAVLWRDPEQGRLVEVRDRIKGRDNIEQGHFVLVGSEGFGNFEAITRYNRSTFYASAVLDLAAAIRAGR